MVAAGLKRSGVRTDHDVKDYPATNRRAIFNAPSQEIVRMLLKT